MTTQASIPIRFNASAFFPGNDDGDDGDDESDKYKDDDGG